MVVPLPVHGESGNVYETDFFVPSMAELNFGTGGDIPTEGTMMPYFSSVQRRYAYVSQEGEKSGAKKDYWSRTGSISNSTSKYYVDTNGGKDISGYTGTQYYIRPAFVLPKDFKIQQRPDGSYTVWNEQGLITLKDIKASDTSIESIVHMTESGVLSPFILLSQKYGDKNVSVLHREHLLPESWNSNYSGTTDYAASGIQTKFEEYAASTLDAPYRALLVSVEVTYKNLNPSDNWERKLSTKCCAIGAEELGIVSGWGLGNIFSYYESSKNKKKKHDEGLYDQWYTRDIQSAFFSSNNRWYDRKPYFVSASGTTSGAPSIQHDLGLCPMLFFDHSTPIRALPDGTYDLVPEDPALAQSVSTMAAAGTPIQLKDIPVSTAGNAVTLKIPETSGEQNYIYVSENYEETGAACAFRGVSTDDSQMRYNGNTFATYGGNVKNYCDMFVSNHLDPSVSSYIVTADINSYSTRSSVMQKVSANAFPLAAYEMGYTNLDAAIQAEGSLLPYFDGATARADERNYYTRTGRDASNVVYVTAGGGMSYMKESSSSAYIRPAILLSPETWFTDNGDGTYTFVGDEPASSDFVSHTVEVPHGQKVVFRQFTQNQKKQFQTMLVGGVYPPLVDNTPKYSEVLAENTWAQIAQAVADKDPILDVWQVGDTKDEVIAGETLTFAIMGKNMDDLADGSGKAGLTFGMTQLMASTRQMNSSNTNAGSFAGSAMYSWLSGTIYPNLPTELKDAIKAVNKKTSSGGGSSSIRTDAMYLWLFAEIEVFGTTTYSYAGEGTQYPYFATTSERIKRLSNGAGAASYWWERSPSRNASADFCRVDTSGSADDYIARGSGGVCFGFCV